MRTICLLPVLVLALAGCSRQDGDGAAAAPAARPPPEVQVRELQPDAGAAQETLVGRLSPLRSAEVRARVPGILLERVYAEGSDVAEGELMFRIDPAPLKAELQAREADLASARARAQNTAAKVERARDLAGRGLIPKQDLDDAEADAREAAAAVAEAQAQVAKARLELSYADVRAPIAGRAGRAQVTEGALVGQGETTPLATVEQIDRLYVDFDVSVAEWERLRRLQQSGDTLSVALTTPAGQPYPQPAEVQFSELSVQPGTGTIAVRAIVPNPEHLLLPGMFVTLAVDVGAGDGPVFRVAQTAVLRDAKGPYVYVLGADGTVQRRDVTLAGTVDQDWRVTGGLDAGDRLIVNGLQKLRPGMPATPAGAGDAAAGQGGGAA